MAVPRVTSVCSGRSQRSGQTERDLAISRNTESKLALPTRSKAAGGKVQALWKSTAVKRRFLAETFISVSKDQFILIPSELTD